MSDNSQGTAKNEEIDLLDLFKRIGRAINSFLRSIRTGILISTVFILKKWLPLFLSILVGIGLSFLAKNIFPPVYKSNLLLKSNTIPVDEMISFVNKLSTYCEEHNRPALASSLSLSPAVAETIYDIRGFWVIDKNRDGISDYIDFREKHNVYDTINIRMRDRFDVRIRVTSPENLLVIRSGILSYINKDSLFSQRNWVRLKLSGDMQSRLSFDIQQLDSLQKVKYFEETRKLMPSSGGQIVFMQEQKTQLLYSDIYNLYSRKQTLESEQILNNGVVTIMSDIIIPAKPITRAMYYGVFIIPSLFILTLLALIITRNSKSIKETFKRY